MKFSVGDMNHIRGPICVCVLQEAKEGSSFHYSQGYEQLVNVLIDLFIAGTDTTSLTLTFGIILLTK